MGTNRDRYYGEALGSTTSGGGAQRVLRVHVKGWWLVLGRMGSVVGEGTDASQQPQAGGRRRRAEDCPPYHLRL